MVLGYLAHVTIQYLPARHLQRVCCAPERGTIKILAAYVASATQISARNPGLKVEGDASPLDTERQ